MLTQDDLQQIGQVMEGKLEAERKHTEKFVREAIQASEQRIKTELKKEIRGAQEDTIDTLTDLIHTGYTLHEKRITRIEEHLDLPPVH